MRLTFLMVALGSRIAAAGIDPDEHGHGHLHKHPHEPDPHHHHKHAHPHEPGEGHHHHFVVEPKPPPAAPPTEPAKPPPPPPPPPHEVRDFHPRRGPPGTEVTISGVRFSTEARVHYNGRPLKTRHKGDTILVVKLPRTAESDVFVVRQKGRPEARSNTSFIVEPAPVITSMAPWADVPGAAIRIRGRNFLPTDRVLFGEIPAQVISSEPERLEVLVPEGASDCRPRVVRDQALATSPRLFRVLAPQPVVTGLQPPAGAPGATVRILGRHFLPTDRAKLGAKPLTILARGPEFLDATVPAGARSGEVLVFGPRRKAKSETEFTVILPPVVTAMEPSWAMPGSRVTLRGRNFMVGDAVMLGDKRADEVRITENEVTFTVPEDAGSGKVAVVRGSARASTRRPLEVVRAPVLTGFEPEGGPGGTRVTIRGEHLAGARVRYGDTKLRPLSADSAQIAVRIPRKAGAARFVVTTRGGEATSADAFEPWEPAVVTSFLPAFGPAGTQVVIQGKNFTPKDTVSLGGQDLAVRSASPEALTVVVPPGVGSGPFVIRSRGKELPTRGRFRVVAPPPAAVLTFTPISGPPGTEVVLRTGRRFTAADQVLLDDNKLVTTLKEGGAKAIVRIPRKARSGRFEVVLATGERITADQPFQVVRKSKPPPSDKPGVY